MTKTLLAFGLSAWCGVVLVGQTPPAGPVTMNTEPHYERLTYLRHMRVFEATVAPGESTLDHLHDHDVASIAVGPVTTRSRRIGEDWGAPRTWDAGAADTALYTGAPATHRTENTGSTPLRLFVIENLREGGWSSPPAVTAPGTTLRHDARSFAIYDVRLSATTPRTNHVHENPSFVFLLSGSVDVQGGGGESGFRLERPGRWFPSSGPDQPHTLTVAGTGDAHVICVEAR
jgi:hypothetical protein